MFFRKPIPKYTYDVFLSHAHEDKDMIANELYLKLCDAGVTVWYSGDGMRIGKGLTKTILDETIPVSRYGVVILSEYYFAATWGRTELNYLYSYEPARKYSVILPIWHGVDEHRVMVEFPYLVDRFALKSEKGIDFIVKEIARKVEEAKLDSIPVPPIIRVRDETQALIHRFGRELIFIISTALLITGAITYKDEILSAFQTPVSFNEAVENRINEVEQYTDAEHQNWLYKNGCVPCDYSIVRKQRARFTLDEECLKHYYELFSRNMPVKGKKGLEASGIHTNDFFSAYGMSNYSACIDSSALQFSYSLKNTEPVKYKILGVEFGNEETQAVVKVSYKEGLRCVIARLDKNTVEGVCASERTLFYGLKPLEEYVFEKSREEWRLIAIK